MLLDDASLYLKNCLSQNDNAEVQPRGRREARMDFIIMGLCLAGVAGIVLAAGKPKNETERQANKIIWFCLAVALLVTLFVA